jgi:hypothetical protein
LFIANSDQLFRCDDAFGRWNSIFTLANIRNLHYRSVPNRICASSREHVANEEFEILDSRAQILRHADGKFSPVVSPRIIFNNPAPEARPRASSASVAQRRKGFETSGCSHTVSDCN